VGDSVPTRVAVGVSVDVSEAEGVSDGVGVSALGGTEGEGVSVLGEIVGTGVSVGVSVETGAIVSEGVGVSVSVSVACL
jgi:hypothetical protein